MSDSATNEKTESTSTVSTITDKRLHSEEVWWRPGILVFSEVTGWIVVPIIIALNVGSYVDKRSGTSNTYFLIFTAVAFMITIIGLVQLTLRYKQKLDRMGHIKKSEKNNGK